VGHDQPFKEFLQAFLREFLRLFYPSVEERLDFREVEFLDKEVFTDVVEGSRREADVIAKLRTHQGRPELVLIHIEVQTTRRRNVPARIFEYYALLWSRYKVPIFPIVVYLRGGKEGLATEEYRVELFGYEVLKFFFETVRLARLDAEEYRKRKDPVGAALGALMDRSRTRSPEELRVSVILRVARSNLDDRRQFLLANLIETYFELTAEQTEAYRRLISRKEYRDVQEVELTWADRLLRQGEEKGLRQGLEQGLQVGLLQGKREALLRVLAAKFGPLPRRVTTRVEAMDSTDELDRCLERAVTASSLEEAGLDCGHSGGRTS
jgi:phosphoglycolate phosphatase-like HAD superfamily hydrolase